MKTESIDPQTHSLSRWIQWGMSELAFLEEEEEAKRECEEILQTLLGISRSELYLKKELSAPLFLQYSQWIQARKSRLPLAYLLGKAYFWEDSFEVEKGVLIPRPETEVLIESFLNHGRFSRNETFRFLDLGTGSGNIGITIAKLFPKSKGAASDLSRKALEVASKNATRLGVSDRLEFIQSDCLSGFEEASFDVIFSNPPYVATQDWETLQTEVREEPRLALDGGFDGLDFYRKIFKELHPLKQGGSLWVEIGWGEERAVRSLFETRGFQPLLTFKDLNGIERVLSGWLNG